MKLPTEATLKRVHAMVFANVYPLYVAKAECKGRTQKEVDTIIRWLTGYTAVGMASAIKKGVDFKTFFAKAPKPHPLRSLVTGVVCGVRVEDIQDPTLKEVRRLDKLVDELAKSKPMESVLRK